MGIYLGKKAVTFTFGNNKQKFKQATPPTPTPYLTFSAPETLSISATYPKWDGTMEYSLDTVNWNTWDGGKISGTELYFRGINNTKITGSENLNYRWTLTGNNISCIGNIENLLDYITVLKGEHPIMSSYCFSYMFKECTNLITAPELPAITLADSCYSYMFSGCTNLTIAPALPATTLAVSCYKTMFYNCTNLIKAPKLPATTLANYCYQTMFYNCTNLTIAPALPATTLATYCYASMFYNCTNLTQVHALPATIIRNLSCYQSMYANCSNIKLSTIETDEYTQKYCIPKSGRISSVNKQYDLVNMFNNTGGTFTGTPEINTTYYLHKDCTIV